jgi:starch synthase (maltosyl-transferring)
MPPPFRDDPWEGIPNRGQELVKLPEGRRRVAVENVAPLVDGGRYPLRRTAGGSVRVEADIFTDGTDSIAAFLEHRAAGARTWTKVRMQPAENDRWWAAFPVPDVGEYEYTIRAWVDPLGIWVADLKKRAEAGRAGAQDLSDGAVLLRRLAERSRGAAARGLKSAARKFEETASKDQSAAIAQALALPVAELSPEPAAGLVTSVQPELRVSVDPAEASASAWYEMFPRSAADAPGRSGTFEDVERWLPYLSELGFDVLYLPPIHPIGEVHRRGPNNAPVAAEGDPGSPWAIGSPLGGHTTFHPDLGTQEQFQHLLAAARAHGLDLALDLAFQCAPDHPWVSEHPSWFRRRSDGSIRPAENPPKRYDDIYPFDFESDDWPELWEALRDVVEHWVAAGVRRFRVDNPHTKPFVFWEWLIESVRARHPDVQFLAEAFTRPKVMYRLAKIGFTHSYTYFAWRNSKSELTEYIREITGPGLREFFRPHLWPNTPDILTDYLQTGGRPAFIARFVLAATLSPNYGIYGPPYELTEARPLRAGSEEYLHSEKYELRHWDRAAPQSIAPVVRRVNQVRKEHPALRAATPPFFHGFDNDQILGFSRATDDGSDRLLVFVNLDPAHVQAGWTDLDLGALAVGPDEPFEVHDLLAGGRWLWQGRRNFVELRPLEMPAHVLALERKGGAR